MGGEAHVRSAAREGDGVDFFISAPQALATGGQRASETRDRVAQRAARVVLSYPSCAIVGEESAAHAIVTIGSNETSVRLAGPLTTETARVLKYNSSLPGSAARVLADGLHQFIGTQLARQIDQQRVLGARLLAQIEVLTAELENALDENQALRDQLHAANIEVDFLRRTVHLLSESARTGRPGLVSKALALVSGILLAIATGVSEGVTSSVVGDPVVVELVTRCEDAQATIDELGPTVEHLPPPTS